MVVIHEQVVDYTDLLKCNCREPYFSDCSEFVLLNVLPLESADTSKGFSSRLAPWTFSSCTTLIVSIFQMLLPSVWRKKIRSSKENLIFNVRASGRKSKHTCFSKASAKVQLFFELTKYFCKKNAKKYHFFRKVLKMRILQNSPF